VKTRVCRNSNTVLADRNHFLHIMLTMVVALIAMCSPPVAAASEQQRQPRPGESTDPEGLKSFTVADSITMTHFNDPSDNDTADAHPKVSPNGKKYLVVTEKGNLDTNVREYSLFVYDLLEPVAKPRKVAVLKSSSNRDGITQAKWLDDDNIAFIGENPGETPQVHIVNWRTAKLKKITADPIGVLAYDISRDLRRIVYYATWHGDDEANKHKDEHGFAVTDESLADLMANTWKIQEGVDQLYIMNRSTHKVQAAKATPFLSPRHGLWLSPNGKYAITEQPAFSIKSDWIMYEQPYIKMHAHDMPSAGQIRKADLTQIMLVDMETGEMKPVLDAPVGVNGPTVAWSSDGRSVFLGDTFLPLDTTDQQELAKRKSSTVVVEVAIPELNIQRVTDIPINEGWELSESHTPESFKARIWRVESEIVKPQPRSEFSKNGDQWVRKAEEEDGPEPGSNIKISQSIGHRPKLVLVDRGSHSETVILDPNPQFDHFQFGRAEVIHWKGKRGEALIGGLVYPVGYTPGACYPLVIQTHGFQPDQFLLDGSFTTAMAAQELANKGIAVLQLGESPLYDKAEGTPDFGPVNLSQYESAIDYLDSLGLIDRQSVGLVGFSITGFTVRYALIHSQYKIAAATSAEGNDWSYWTYVLFGEYPGMATQAEMPYGGPPWPGNWKSWMEESIGFNYDKIHTPLRLESDSNPGDVISEWENFFVLHRLHKPVELIYIPHGDHPVVKPWDRMTSQQGNVDWMVFWLKADEDPDASKAEEYKRWHKLREVQEANKKLQVDQSARSEN
jgi:dipeptidyl aminopeptidase/acylaminoacyl peptidase